MDQLNAWNIITNDIVADVSKEILPEDIVEIDIDIGRTLDGTVKDKLNNTECYLDTQSLTQPKNLSCAEDDNAIFLFNSVAISDNPINLNSAAISICPACGLELDSLSKWKTHLNNTHKYNTLEGLNFKALNKLHHQCLECYRKIAMYSMENLLKHKFIHLPFSCSKCKICHKQYRYRQDLMFHLRSTHRDFFSVSNQSYKLEIGNVKENAVDIFENSNDHSIAVRNELLDSGGNEKNNSTLSPFQQINEFFNNSSSKSVNDESYVNNELFKYIEYVCPKCGKKFELEEIWRQHIIKKHDFGTRKGLNFKPVNKNWHAQCLECNKIVYKNTIKNLQIHCFSHLPFGIWMHCKLCRFNLVEKTDIINHISSQHKQELDTLFEDSDDERDIHDQYIDYLCPQCGNIFLKKKDWRNHLVLEHDFRNFKKLNFKVINERQVICLECDKLITNAYGVQNAQQHRITHMPYKSFIRCRLCTKSYTDRKGLIKHLRSVHHISDECQESPILEDVELSQVLSSAARNTNKQLLRETVQYGDCMYIITCTPEGNSLQISQSSIINIEEKCHLCPCLFSTSSQLQMHIMTSHGINDNNTVSDVVLKTNPHNMSNESSIKEDSQFSATDLMSILEKNISYLCPACGLECELQTDWRRHINSAHHFDIRQHLNFKEIDKFHYQCNECKDIVSSNKLKGLQDHKFRHLPHRLYIKCLICGTCYNHKPNMISHLKVRHKINADSEKLQNTIQLAVAPEQNLKPENWVKEAEAIESVLLKSEMAINYKEKNKYVSDHNEITYFCPQCSKQFDSHLIWRKHIIEVHKLYKREILNFRALNHSNFLCLECYTRVKVKPSNIIKQLQSHKFCHLPFKPFKCITCSNSFQRKRMFFKHLNEDNNCGKRKLSVSEILIRDDVNVKKKVIPQVSSDLILNKKTFDLVCPECCNIFNSPELWYEHIKTEHYLDKPDYLKMDETNYLQHKCTICSETVVGVKWRDLVVHRFNHLPYGAHIRCKLCGSKYFTIRRLQMHLREKHLNVVQNHEEYAMMDYLLMREESSIMIGSESNVK